MTRAEILGHQSVEVISDQLFRRGVIVAVLVTLLLPIVLGGLLLGFIGYYPLPAFYRVFLSYTGWYLLALSIPALGLAHLAANHLIRVAVANERQFTDRAGRVLYAMPGYLLLFLFVYSCGAAVTVNWSLEQMGVKHYALRDYLYTIAALFPLSLISTFPVCYFFTGFIGRYFGARGVHLLTSPLWMRVVMLGLVTPLLITSVLLGYVHNRTGFFSLQTAGLWLVLMLLAGVGTWMAWQALRQGLQPLQQSVAAEQSPLMTPPVAQTLDELGEMVGHWAALQRSEQRLRELVQQNERRFRATFDQAAVGVALVRPDGRWFQVNRRLCEMLGYSAEEMARLQLQDITYADDLDEEPALKNRVLAGEMPSYTLEKRFRKKNGEAVWTNLTMSLVCDEVGQPKYFVKMVEDIHAHKLAILALDASRASLEEAQNLAHLGSWELDLVTGVLSWSDEMYRIFEIDKAKFGASYAAFLERIHPDDRAMVHDGYSNSVRDYTAYELSHRLLFAGERVKYVQERGVTFYGDDGTPLRSIGTAQEITERVLAENRLAQVLERNRQTLAFVDELVNTANVMVVGLDDQGKVRLFNDEAERVTGYLRRDVTGRDWFSQVVPSERFPEVWERFDRIRQGGELERSFSYPIVTVSGEERLISWRNSRLINDEGEWVTVAFGLDITESHRIAEATERARQAAEQANQAKSDFLANMSHEIRTPMNAIIGMGQLALAEGPPPHIADYLRKIQGASRSLLGIVNDVLDYSKLESGRMQIEALPFRLSEVLQGVDDLFSLRAREQGLQFSIQVSPELPDALLGDPLRLGQVLNNLVGNAIKFTEQGRVSVSVTQAPADGESVVLHFVVEDTGIGISDAQMARLFQPFAQADGSISRRYGGTGLGLVISRNLVEQMGGTLTVVSTPGAGTLFRFDVTVRANRAEQSAKPQPPRPAQQTVLPARAALPMVDDGVNLLVASYLQSIGGQQQVQATEMAHVEASSGAVVATAEAARQVHRVLDALWSQLNEHELVSEELVDELAVLMQGRPQWPLFKRLCGQIEQFNYTAALTLCSALRVQLEQAGDTTDAS